jgi:hypothetical protein
MPGYESRDWHIGSFMFSMHGQVCFATTPHTKWDLGNYQEVMFFDHSTVIRTSGTYFIVDIPGYILLASFLFLAAGATWIIFRRRLLHPRFTP